jgi:hypothetical protein
MKLKIIFLLAVLTSIESKAQNIFERLTTEIKEYTIDTSNVPDDKITAVIRKLRSAKGGFNINEAIDYKIQEEVQKNPAAKDSMMKIAGSFKNGDPGRWLDNAVIWIYRKEFSYKELKQILKFYKTPAGQKMAKDFPVIMLKSLRASEIILERLKK